MVRNTQDMWVCSSDGRPTLEDKVFEVHEWRDGKYVNNRSLSDSADVQSNSELPIKVISSYPSRKEKQ